MKPYVLPDRRLLRAEQIAQMVAPYSYRTAKYADWTCGDLPIVGLVIDNLLTQIDAMPDLGPPDVEGLVRDVMAIRLTREKACDWVRCEPDRPHQIGTGEICQLHVLDRIGKLTLDALRELHASLLLRDHLGVSMIYSVDADTKYGHDITFRPPPHWHYPGPIAVQIQTADRVYTKPRRCHDDPRGTLRVMLIIPRPAGGYDGSTNLATREVIEAASDRWRTEIRDAEPP